MRFRALLVTVLLSASVAFAQDDPVVMRIAETTVLLSELEYAYHKNYAPDERGSNNLGEFAESYLDYKLKVQAALDAHLDTLTTLRTAYERFRNRRMARPFVRSPQLETEVRRTYEVARHEVEARGGMVKVAHILLALRQDATENQRRVAERRADSVYRALRKGADFSEMARRCSDDSKTAPYGGELPWLTKGETVKKFEDVAFALKEGELSRPFLSEFGYHIVLLRARQPYFSYESQRDELYRQVEMGKLREAAMRSKDVPGGLMALKEVTLATDVESEEYQDTGQEEDLLLREYHDGLLLYEITNRTIWEKVGNDENALAAYYKRHKKEYRWEQPRFKGVAFYVRNYNDVKKALQVLEKTPSSQWKSALERTFNKDSEEGIKIEEGLFLPGDHPLVDRNIFHAGIRPSPYLGFHVGATHGKLLKKGPETYEDVRSLVLADYLEYLEREWVSSLRKRYPTTVDKNVLATIK